jgi:hypothetical protein
MALEDEYAKLRKVVADLSLDKEMLQHVIRNEACPEAEIGGRCAWRWNVSIRRACRVLLFDASSYHVSSRWAGRVGKSDQGDLPDACALRLSARSRAAAR